MFAIRKSALHGLLGIWRACEIAASPSANRITTKIDTRSALIDGILNRKQIS